MTIDRDHPAVVAAREAVVTHGGDAWVIVSTGAMRDGKVFCHLASKTRFRQQANGRIPVQIADWIDEKIVLSAHMQAEEEQRRQHRITQYYTDRANSGNSTREARR